MSLTYTTFVNSLVNLVPVPSAADPGFATALPNAIDDAEQRLYRELDLLNTVVTDNSATLTTGTRVFNLPSSIGTFVVTDRINVIAPASATAGSPTAVRNPLTPASKEFLDFVWPSMVGSTVPVYFAMLSQSTVILGPFPDQAYSVEVSGTIRPAALSASNATTLLSVYFPDLLIAAAMVFMAGYMKNYGSAVDDPQQGVTWEQHLGKLMTSAQTEEARKKFNQAGWSAKQPAPMATPART